MFLFPPGYELCKTIFSPDPDKIIRTTPRQELMLNHANPVDKRICRSKSNTTTIVYPCKHENIEAGKKRR